jgi:hypothetical protein
MAVLDRARGSESGPRRGVLHRAAARGAARPLHRGLTVAEARARVGYTRASTHWGQDPVLEKHDVPERSQRARSVLTFVAQDTGTNKLVYANADISKATHLRIPGPATSADQADAPAWRRYESAAYGGR